MERASALKCPPNGTHDATLFLGDARSFSFVVRLLPGFRFGNVALRLKVGELELESQHVITPELWTVSLSSPKSNRSAVQSSDRGVIKLLAGVDFEQRRLFVRAVGENWWDTTPIEPPARFPDETLGGVRRSHVELHLEWTSLRAPFRLDVVESASMKFSVVLLVAASAVLLVDAAAKGKKTKEEPQKKVCDAKKGANRARKNPEELSGKALVEYINKHASWKASSLSLFSIIHSLLLQAQINKGFLKAKFSDLKKLAGVKPDVQRVTERERTHQADFVPPSISRLSESDLPKEFDARKQWPECANQINKIFDQSSCGSCWSVSSTTSLADRFCIASKGKLQPELSVFRPRLVLYGMRNVVRNLHHAYKYMADYGVVSGGNYTQKSGCLSYPYPPCEHGNGDEIGNFPVCFHKAGRFLGLHAVRVIGWGEEEGVPYWLVANSWNEDWGDKGYFKIKRGTNECGIESVADAALPDLERSMHGSGVAGAEEEEEGEC
ncbi:Pept-C1 domain-containing protein [Aphelenchoides fujianensis]|nr:Pept-C1 domain-containing protein [Aphelenchoides fujianensis]